MLTDEDDAVVREQLKMHGFTEAHRVVAEYKCLRQVESGALQEVRVQVMDAGPSNPNARYSWRVWIPTDKEQAREDERTYVLGNPADSIYAAGAILHWRTLESWLAQAARC